LEFAKIERVEASWGDFRIQLGEGGISELKDIATREGVSCEGFWNFGNPTDEIPKEAEEKDVSIIIVGLRGLHGVQKLRSLSGVARRVIENSKRPVVVIPG
jgi:nucleotide-binding universal stress UspA family protein